MKRLDKFGKPQFSWFEGGWPERLLQFLMYAVVAFIMACAFSVLFDREAQAATIGKATYYTFKSCRVEGTSGYYTASGERYREYKMTAALRSRDFGRSYRVTNVSNGKSVVVKHNDYGPGKRPAKDGVVIDLSPAAYDALGGKRGVNKKGIAYGEIKVKVEAL